MPPASSDRSTWTSQQAQQNAAAHRNPYDRGHGQQPSGGLCSVTQRHIGKIRRGAVLIRRL